MVIQPVGGTANEFISALQCDHSRPPLHKRVAYFAPPVSAISARIRHVSPGESRRAAEATSIGNFPDVGVVDRLTSTVPTNLRRLCDETTSRLLPRYVRGPVRAVECRKADARMWRR